MWSLTQYRYHSLLSLSNRYFHFWDSSFSSLAIITWWPGYATLLFWFHYSDWIRFSHLNYCMSLSIGPTTRIFSLVSILHKTLIIPNLYSIQNPTGMSASHFLPYRIFCIYCNSPYTLTMSIIFNFNFRIISGWLKSYKVQRVAMYSSPSYPYY